MFRILVVLLAFFTTPAFADPYFNLNAGPAFVAPISTSAGSVKSKRGYLVSGSLGWNITPQIAVEAEVGTIQAAFDTLATRTTLNGNSSTWFGFANAIFHPWNIANFRPLIGAGIGPAFNNTSLNSIGIFPVAFSQDKTALAAQGIAGLDYEFNKSLTISARYRYLWIGNAQTFNIAGVPVTTGDTTVHIITASLVYRF